MKISELIIALLKAWIKLGNIPVATTCYQKTIPLEKGSIFNFYKSDKYFIIGGS